MENISQKNEKDTKLWIFILISAIINFLFFLIPLSNSNFKENVKKEPIKIKVISTSLVAVGNDKKTDYEIKEEPKEIKEVGEESKSIEQEQAKKSEKIEKDIKNSRKNDSKVNSNVVNNKPKTLTTPSQNAKNKKVEVAKSTGGTNEKNVSTQKDLLKTISSSNTNTKEVLKKSGNGTNKQLATNISAPTVTSNTGGTVTLNPYKAPIYPASAKANGVTGTVVVKIEVKNNISRIISTKGPSELKDAVNKVSPSWRATIKDTKGNYINGTVSVTINFIM
ncbi:MAG: energy transducer TonB [Fusobacteriaceae bacterium]|nr:energy transducer TonB [Fusobacteriaceae bacterium]MBN2837831.1 energy transducer TonB [Fusobacteriaceae bacterium]